MRKVILLAAFAIGMQACNDEIVVPQQSEQDGAGLSRAPYDHGAVEWDNVASLQIAATGYASSLALPWEPGSAQSAGIPEDWIDQNLRNSDPKMRAYSRENGWVMAFHNLLDANQPNKYFALYNKMTGILRLFFYELSNSADPGTTNSFMGMRVAGSSSLLNFAGPYPAPMSERKTNPAVLASPKCSITISTDTTQTGIGYKARNWYGIEIECAYDAGAVSSNYLSARLWGQDISSINVTGNMSGTITGTIETTYDNVPSGFNISIGSVDFSKESNNGNTSITIGETSAKNRLQAEASKGGNFFTNLWNNVKKKVPELANKSAMDGLAAIFSGGTSYLTGAIGNLVNSVTGRSMNPMTSNSTVDLGLKATITMNGNTQKDIVGWGTITPFSLPEYATPNYLYNGKLGVWNLNSVPTLNVDLYAVSYFYPRELAPNQNYPRASEVYRKFQLTTSSVVINPEILANYSIANLSQRLVYTSAGIYNLVGVTGGTAYGLSGVKEFYAKADGSNTISETAELRDMPLNITNPTFDPESAYAFYWEGYDRGANEYGIMCHVSFELVSKTNSQERYFYAKYFPVKAVKRNFYHSEEIITRSIIQQNSELFKDDEKCAVILAGDKDIM